MSTFLAVRQGIVTGADSIFIRPTEEVPTDECAVYMPFLRDRDMVPYAMPPSSGLSVFYPFIKEQRVDEDRLKTEFPRTWAYLKAHREKLESRKSPSKCRKAWWEPMWLRPESMRRKKLVAPHLVLMPRFAVDLDGAYATSHGPILVATTPEAEEDDLLRYFCAILNSSVCYWHIARHSHTYSRGYVMLEPKTLRDTPVPDPSAQPSRVIKRLLRLVDERMAAPNREAASKLEKALDELVADLYSLTAEERSTVGLE